MVTARVFAIVALAAMGCSPEDVLLAQPGGVVQQKVVVFRKSVDQAWFRGDANRWGKTAMELVADHTWRLDVEMLGVGCAFKVDVEGDWSVAYGQDGDVNYDNQGVLALRGSNVEIFQCSVGRYRIEFNDVTHAYSATRHSYATTVENIYIDGLSGYGGMGLMADHQWVGLAAIDASFSAAPTIKFSGTLLDGAAFLLGDTDQDGVAEAGGAGIPVTVGVHRVEFNELTNQYRMVRIPSPFTSVNPSMNLRGTFNSWGNQPMELVGHKKWAALVDFPQDNGRFKFDVKGDWSINYGDNKNTPDGSDLVRNGTDITVPTSGTYHVSVYEEGMQYVVSKLDGWVSVAQAVELIPSYDNVSAPAAEPIPMQLTRDNTWEGDVSFRHLGYPRVTLRVTTSSGQKVYGTTNTLLDPQFGLVENATGIPMGLPGAYKVMVDDKAMTAYFYGTESPYPPASYSRPYYRGTSNKWVRAFMTRVTDEQWEVLVRVQGDARPRFKFFMDGQGDGWLGDANLDGVAETTGGDIPLPGDGAYLITLNPLTLAYAVQKQDSSTYGKATMELRKAVVRNGRLESDPLADVGMCLDRVNGSQFCLYGSTYVTPVSGEVVVDLPAGDHTAIFSKMYNRYYSFSDGPHLFTVTAGQSTKKTVVVASEHTCVKVYANVGYGNALYLTGQSEFLGDWKKAKKLTWTGEHWYFSGYAPAGLTYKIVKAPWVEGDEISTDNVQWERGRNHVLEFNAPSYMGTCSTVSPSF